MYNLNKNNIIQDEFGRPLTFIQKIKNKLATIDFTKLKSEMGPSILTGLKTGGKWLLNVLKAIYMFLPLICILILTGYILFQVILFLANNIIPLFTDFKGWIEFSNKLPYAFHTDLPGLVKFGRILLWFVTAMSLPKLMEIVDADREYSEYPTYSYVVVLITGLFITCLIIPNWFNWLCIISAVISAIYMFMNGGDSTSSRSSYRESRPERNERKERPEHSETKTETVVETPKKKKQIVSAYQWNSSSVMVVYDNGSQQAIPGKFYACGGGTVTVTDSSGHSFKIIDGENRIVRSWYQP